MRARRDWQEIFQVMKSRDLQPRLLYPAKLSFRIGGQIKCFPDKKKLKELIITKPLYFLNFIYLFFWNGPLCIHLVWDCLCFLDLRVYFLHQIREGFFHYFFKEISNFLLFLFSFWYPSEVNVEPLEVVPRGCLYYLHFFGFYFLLVVLIGCFLLPHVPNH